MSDTIVSSAVLEAEVEQLEDKIDEYGKFWAGAERKVADWLIAEFRDAMKRAGELYATTTATARATGWSDQTLCDRARRRLAGERLAPPWDQVQVMRDGSGYSFRLSTVPPKPR